MWVLFAFGSALFAGITAILAKIGIKEVNSNVATAIRTVVIVIFSWLIVFISGSQSTISSISSKSLIFLVLSGLSTGASWICYFRALQLGNVNKVTPIDKSSTILTMILAFIFLHEAITPLMLVGMLAIGSGTFLMIQKQNVEEKEESKSWLMFAILSAVFASLTSILGKVGISGVDSNLGTAIRTIVVLIFAWAIVIAQGRTKEIKNIDSKSWLFLILSGLTTGLSWLCYYRALQDGLASVVVPIDKLSIVVSIVFARIILKEKLSPKALIGLLLIVAGTLVLLIKI